MKISNSVKLLFLYFVCGTGILHSQSNALNYNGTGDNVSLSYTTSLDFSLSDKFTVEGWFRTTNITTVLYSNLIDVAPYLGYEVAIVNTKLVFSQCNNYVSNMVRIETVNSFNDGNWHHFACVYKGIPNATNEDIYVDGAIQTKSVTNNNLSSSFNSPTAVHIGSRNNSAYFLNGTLDEFRVWGKALCVAEVTARKNCELLGNEPVLLAYWNFNQGIAAGNNSTVTILPDISGNNNTGTLTTFALSGNFSNWIASTASVSGFCNYPGPISITGSPLMCIGNSNTLTAGGATSYTWSTASNNSSIVISPTITTTYSVSGTNSVSGCYGSSMFTQTVSACTGIQNYFENPSVTLAPNPTNGEFTIWNLRYGTVVEIYNTFGDLIYDTKADTEEIVIHLPYINTGLYIIKFRSGQHITTSKFIKN